MDTFLVRPNPESAYNHRAGWTLTSGRSSKVVPECEAMDSIGGNSVALEGWERRGSGGDRPTRIGPEELTETLLYVESSDVLLWVSNTCTEARILRFFGSLRII